MKTNSGVVRATRRMLGVTRNSSMSTMLHQENISSLTHVYRIFSRPFARSFIKTLNAGGGVSHIFGPHYKRPGTSSADYDAEGMEERVDHIFEELQKMYDMGIYSECTRLSVEQLHMLSTGQNLYLDKQQSSVDQYELEENRSMHLWGWRVVYLYTLSPAQCWLVISSYQKSNDPSGAARMLDDLYKLGQYAYKNPLQVVSVRAQQHIPTHVSVQNGRKEYFAIGNGEEEHAEWMEVTDPEVLANISKEQYDRMDIPLQNWQTVFKVCIHAIKEKELQFAYDMISNATTLDTKLLDFFVFHATEQQNMEMLHHIAQAVNVEDYILPSYFPISNLFQYYAEQGLLDDALLLTSKLVQQHSQQCLGTYTKLHLKQASAFEMIKSELLNWTTVEYKTSPRILVESRFLNSSVWNSLLHVMCCMQCTGYIEVLTQMLLKCMSISNQMKQMPQYNTSTSTSIVVKDNYMHINTDTAALLLKALEQDKEYAKMLCWYVTFDQGYVKVVQPPSIHGLKKKANYIEATQQRQYTLPKNIHTVTSMIHAASEQNLVVMSDVLLEQAAYMVSTDKVLRNLKNLKFSEDCHQVHTEVVQMYTDVLSTLETQAHFQNVQQIFQLQLSKNEYAYQSCSKLLRNSTLYSQIILTNREVGRVQLEKFLSLRSESTAGKLRGFVEIIDNSHSHNTSNSNHPTVDVDSIAKNVQQMLDTEVFVDMVPEEQVDKDLSKEEPVKHIDTEYRKSSVTSTTSTTGKNMQKKKKAFGITLAQFESRLQRSALKKQEEVEQRRKQNEAPAVALVDSVQTEESLYNKSSFVNQRHRLNTSALQQRDARELAKALLLRRENIHSKIHAFDKQEMLSDVLLFTAALHAAAKCTSAVSVSICRQQCEPIMKNITHFRVYIDKTKDVLYTYSMAKNLPIVDMHRLNRIQSAFFHEETAKVFPLHIAQQYERATLSYFTVLLPTLHEFTEMKKGQDQFDDYLGRHPELSVKPSQAHSLIDVVNYVGATHGPLVPGVFVLHKQTNGKYVYISKPNTLYSNSIQTDKTAFSSSHIIHDRVPLISSVPFKDYGLGLRTGVAQEDVIAKYGILGVAIKTLDKTDKEIEAIHQEKVSASSFALDLSHTAFLRNLWRIRTHYYCLLLTRVNGKQTEQDANSLLWLMRGGALLYARNVDSMFHTNCFGDISRQLSLKNINESNHLLAAPTLKQEASVRKTLEKQAERMVAADSSNVKSLVLSDLKKQYSKHQTSLMNVDPHALAREKHIGLLNNTPVALDLSHLQGMVPNVAAYDAYLRGISSEHYTHLKLSDISSNEETSAYKGYLHKRYANEDQIRTQFSTMMRLSQGREMVFAPYKRIKWDDTVSTVLDIVHQHQQHSVVQNDRANVIKTTNFNHNKPNWKLKVMARVESAYKDAEQYYKQVLDEHYSVTQQTMSENAQHKSPSMTPYIQSTRLIDMLVPLLKYNKSKQTDTYGMIKVPLKDNDSCSALEKYLGYKVYNYQRVDIPSKMNTSFSLPSAMQKDQLDLTRIEQNISNLINTGKYNAKMEATNTEYLEPEIYTEEVVVKPKNMEQVDAGMEQFYEKMDRLFKTDYSKLSHLTPVSVQKQRVDFTVQQATIDTVLGFIRDRDWVERIYYGMQQQVPCKSIPVMPLSHMTVTPRSVVLDQTLQEKQFFCGDAGKEIVQTMFGRSNSMQSEVTSDLAELGCQLPQKQWGYTPNVASLVAMVSAAETNNDLDTAMHLFIQIAHHLHTQRIVSNDMSYRLLTKAQGKKMEVEYIKTPFPHDEQLVPLFFANMETLEKQIAVQSGEIAIETDPLDMRTMHMNNDYTTMKPADLPPVIQETDVPLVTMQKGGIIKIDTLAVFTDVSSPLGNPVPNLFGDVSTELDAVLPRVTKKLLDICVNNDDMQSFLYIAKFLTALQQSFITKMGLHHARGEDEINLRNAEFAFWGPEHLYKYMVLLHKQYIKSLTPDEHKNTSVSINLKKQLMNVYKYSAYRGMLPFWSMPTNLQDLKYGVAIDLHGLSRVETYYTVQYNVEFLYAAYVCQRLDALHTLYNPTPGTKSIDQGVIPVNNFTFDQGVHFDRIEAVQSKYKTNTSTPIKKKAMLTKNTILKSSKVPENVETLKIIASQQFLELPINAKEYKTPAWQKDNVTFTNSRYCEFLAMPQKCLQKALSDGMMFCTGKGTAENPSLNRLLLPMILSELPCGGPKTRRLDHNQGVLYTNGTELLSWLETRFHAEYPVLAVLPVTTAEVVDGVASTVSKVSLDTIYDSKLHKEVLDQLVYSNIVAKEAWHREFEQCSLEETFLVDNMRVRPSMTRAQIQAKTAYIQIKPQKVTARSIPTAVLEELPVQQEQTPTTPETPLLVLVQKEQLYSQFADLVQMDRAVRGI